MAYVIARHEGESIEILDGLIEVKVLSVTGRIVRLGFNAPREIPIRRVPTEHQAQAAAQSGGDSDED